MTKIIDEFIDRYSREYDYYQELARICAYQCESALENVGVRNIVTYRAKRPDVLRQKIISRNIKKKYRNVEDVYSDIVDLAGIRIALYFPGDREEVRKFIQTNFVNLSESKEFPDRSKMVTSKDYKKKYPGYGATHYRVRLKDDNLDNETKRYARAPIEIQVASVLMHSWAEVEHDLVYKPFTGKISEEEHAILDEINGLILAGEIVLERLQDAVKQRVASNNKVFINHYDLAAFISDNLPAGHEEPLMGRIDLLLRFLQLTGQSKPADLKQYLADVDLMGAKQPVSEQIIDMILIEKESFYKKLEQAKHELIRKNPYIAKEEIQTEDKYAHKFFMSRWIALEKMTMGLAALREPEKKKRYINAVSLMKIFIKIFNLNPDELYQIESIRRLRNQIVHGIKPPPREYVMDAGNYIEHFINNLKNKNEEPAIKAIVCGVIAQFSSWEIAETINLEKMKAPFGIFEKNLFVPLFQEFSLTRNAEEKGLYKKLKLYTGFSKGPFL